MAKIIHNRIKCKVCGDIIESKHRHDFVRCKCGACFTDGGHDYIRRGWEAGLEEVPYEEMDEIKAFPTEIEKEEKKYESI